jgi:DNA-binding NarL/FixJ family response regulator
VIRVFVVEDHEVVRLGLRAFFAMIPDIDLVGEAANGATALKDLAKLAERDELPDIVLMDLVMRGQDGIRLTGVIKQAYPNVEVVAVTAFGETQRVVAALQAGAAGYVLKDADVDEIVVAIRAAHRGQVHLDPAVARALTESLVTPRRGVAALTARERDVLTLVAQGKSNREIANALKIGERTVQTHLSSVLTKLRLVSRTQAALWAVREGLVQP